MAINGLMHMRCLCAGTRTNDHLAGLSAALPRVSSQILLDSVDIPRECRVPETCKYCKSIRYRVIRGW